MVFKNLFFWGIITRKRIQCILWRRTNIRVSDSNSFLSYLVENTDGLTGEVLDLLEN